MAPLEKNDEELLSEEMDHLILMHRDAHFGGDFRVMIDYYQDEDRVGVQLDLDPERILYLAQVEEKLETNLAATLLSAGEAEVVARSRRAYERLKEIYEVEEEKNPIPRLLADLIFAENPEPVEEMEAIISQGTRLVPELLAIVCSEESYSPLFPGYGLAPLLAIECLGKIGDPQAVRPLFELLAKDYVREEETIISALHGMGDPAKDFLLQVVRSRPLTTDNTSAAYALTLFAERSDVALTCFDQLHQSDVLQKPMLRTYLVLCCYGLKGTERQDELIKLADLPDFPEDLTSEIEAILHDWMS